MNLTCGIISSFAQNITSGFPCAMHTQYSNSKNGIEIFRLKRKKKLINNNNDGLSDGVSSTHIEQLISTSSNGIHKYLR